MADRDETDREGWERLATARQENADEHAERMQIAARDVEQALANACRSRARLGDMDALAVRCFGAVWPALPPRDRQTLIAIVAYLKGGDQ